jgi:hypothetical protein
MDKALTEDKSIRNPPEYTVQANPILARVIDYAPLMRLATETHQAQQP